MATHKPLKNVFLMIKKKTNNNGLIIFIKNPVLGQVKTRLASNIGNEKALLVYQHLLQHTQNITQALSSDKHLFYSYFIDEDDQWLPTNYYKHLQVNGNLGVKMKAAFRRLFSIRYKRLVIIGSDCYELQQHHIETAFLQLQQYDFVVGPAKDGGYYLLGMNTLALGIFDNIVWSSDAVFSQTIHNIEQLNKNYFLLPPLSDVDYVTDLQAHPSLLNIITNP